eukprot:gene27246-biopygen17773
MALLRIWTGLGSDAAGVSIR